MATCFIVHTAIRIIIFGKSNYGLFYHDTTNKDFTIDTTATHYALVETVRENKRGFTPRQFKRAQQAREVLAIVGHPSHKDFTGMSDSKMVTNCPVTSTDAISAFNIFGKDLDSIYGKPTRSTPATVSTDLIKIPRTLLRNHRKLTVEADLMFINTLPFFVTISRGLAFITVQKITSRKQLHLEQALQKVNSIYRSKRLTINHLPVDREFECPREFCENLGISLNTTSANEYVPDVERDIRVIMERFRGIRHTLSFKIIFTRIQIELVYFTVFWLNFFPSINGLSTTLSPRTILTGIIIDYKTHCRLPFGVYAQVHEENTPVNSMTSRSTGAIYLGPLGNIQGDYKFLSLTTGRKLSRRQITILPMPSDVIRRVEQLATQEKQTSSLVILDRRKHLISDDTSTIPDDTPATDDSVSSSSSNDDTTVDGNSPSDIPTTGVMGGDNNNTDPNITGVIDEELARANEISQENVDCQEVSTDTRQEVDNTDYDADNDSDDEELHSLILRDADYDSDDDDDDSDNDDDDKEDDVKDAVKDNDVDDSDDEDLLGLTIRNDDSDSDGDSDNEEEEPPPGSESKKNKQRNEKQQKKEPPKDAYCQEDDEGEPKDTRPKKKKEDPTIVRVKDPRSEKNKRREDH